MVSKTLYQLKRSLGWFICRLALVFSGALTPRSQEGPSSPQAPAGEQTDQLQQHLQQLRQQYDPTTRELTQRIAVLEQEIEKQKEKQEKELGPLTGTGSGILNMAIVGGAILPVLQGAIADRVGLHHAFFLPVICYLSILFYGLSGSKPNSERYAKA